MVRVLSPVAFTQSGLMSSTVRQAVTSLAIHDGETRNGLAAAEAQADEV
jgi:hypothetical protein